MGDTCKLFISDDEQKRAEWWCLLNVKIQPKDFPYTLDKNEFFQRNSKIGMKLWRWRCDNKLHPSDGSETK